MGGVSVSAEHPVLAAAVEAARAAGEVAMKYYRGGFDVVIKPDQTPVTQADREGEQVITQNLGRHIPFWAVLIGLEEGGEVTAGVVLNPVTDELFTARRGGGAYRNGE